MAQAWYCMPIIAALGRQRQNLRMCQESVHFERSPASSVWSRERFEIQSLTFPLYYVSGPSAHSDIGLQGFSACQHAISLAVCLASSESLFRPQDKCHMFNSLRPPLTFFLLLNKKFLPRIPPLSISIAICAGGGGNSFPSPLQPSVCLQLLGTPFQFSEAAPRHF